MLTIRTLIAAFFLGLSLSSFATGDAPSPKEKNTISAVATKASGTAYAFRLDNSVNKNNTVDSVLVILDKFDHTGAGVVRKVFYPNADNQIVIEDLAAGKYYAEIYVLGIYKKHFSTIINTEKTGKKNKVSLQLDYTDVYVPGNANIPAENIKSFSYSR